MGVLFLFLVTVLVPCVLGQEQGECFGAGSVAGAVIGGFIAALILVAAAYYFKKLYWNARKGKHLVFSTDPESVKDEFAFDNPGFRQEERNAWRHEAPTLPMGGKPSVLQAEFTKPEESRDDSQMQRVQVRKVKLWARDFTGLGLTCSGGARDGVHVHSVLRSGPAAAANLQPGDKIKSIKIELIGTPLEDAVSIFSLASPYPVELEVCAGGRVSGAGRGGQHPVMKKAGSTNDVHTLEKEARLLHPAKSPDTSHSNNSTLETKHKTGIKKITEKIITTAERKKKEIQSSTLERENEKNAKLCKPYAIDPTVNMRPEKNRYSSGAEIQMQQENGIGHNSVEHAEMQKRESDPRRAMKFGIRVLPPNVPDDGVLKQKSVENGEVSEIKSVNVNDKPEPVRPPPPTVVRHEVEQEPKKPVVAKRREKIAPPVPNARTKHHDSDTNLSRTTSKASDSSDNLSRGELNSSGIKRDENGIPQELPQHMMDAAKVARNNRKSSIELLSEKEKPEYKKEEAPKPKKEEAPKPAKKSKGKAPSPPARVKNKTDDSILEQMKNVCDFLSNEKHHSSLLHDSSFITDNKFETSYNTSTPKVNKTKSISRLGDSTINSSIGFSQDEIDEMVGKPFKRESDSLNNYFEDSRSNFSSNLDVRSVVSLNPSDKSEKGSTTIELNNSDVTIHSSPPNDTVHSTSDNASLLDENERKAASLGDLSRFELRTKAVKPSLGTLERAQSLDISAEDAEITESNLSPKKRKAMSVVESTFYDATPEDVLPDMMESEKGIVIKHKEPRLSLNIAKTSAIEGLSTFQKNRLKKGSEFGNLEDAIVKGSSSSIESDKNDSHNISNISHPDIVKENESHETSDSLAKRIMDENLKVHLKLVSEFAKTTSDGSETLSSFEHEQEVANNNNEVIPEKDNLSYDTNIPDDMKVSRSSYVNSLERPKSDLMKKLLAKNPILNVHIDQQNLHKTEPTSSNRETSQKSLTDSFKSSMHQPDIVNFDLKTSEPSEKEYDDFVSNVKVGSNNNTLNKPLRHSQEPEWSLTKDTRNIVTVNKQITEDKPIQEDKTTFTKSIEIGEPTMRIVPDVIDGIKRRREKDNTVYMEPANMSLTVTQEPVQKTVTVNVTEDEFGNQVITHNVEKISTKYITTKTEAPLQVEQISVGMIRNPGDISKLNLEEGEVKDIDKKVLDEIKRQNPNMVFTSDEPSYTKTETIILNTSELNEEQAKALMNKFKNDPTFMADKTPEELSKLGVKIIRQLDDVESKDKDTVEMTKTTYSINPAAVIPNKSSTDISMERKNDHVTEIKVITPRTEKSRNQTEIKTDKIASRQRAPPLVEPPLLSYELDIEMLSDFISNERHHTARQINEIKKRTKTNTNEPKTRHADYDLPRNSQIKFRTSTYEPPKGTIITSTDLENRRLSQLDQMHLRGDDQTIYQQKPVILAKPSNIPVKSPVEKLKSPVVSSKIPIFTSQKSLSQENLTEKSFSLPHSPPPKLSSSSTNITVTSIKSSSKSPSGGRL